MASAHKKMPGLSLLAPIIVPLALGSVGYAAWRTNWRIMLHHFLTGPGRLSRILLLLVVLLNRKSLPFAWTYRVFYGIVYHSIVRKSPTLGPKALFKHVITETHTPILEMDYNGHKSNSTYFSDLDTSRTHLVTYLCRPGLRAMTYNSSSRLVLDPKTNEPIKGNLGVMLGSVECSFKREIPGYKTYELWSRAIAWDRKWMYIVTHFVPKGAAKPTSWLDSRTSKKRARGPKDATGGWEGKIYATAISKYVFKVGRFTVNPGLVLESSGLLPERPGGWTSGEDQVGDMSVDLSDVDLSVEGEWDWRRVEAQRRKGMELAGQFHDLDKLHETFDGGNNGAIGFFAS